MASAPENEALFTSQLYPSVNPITRAAQRIGCQFVKSSLDSVDDMKMILGISFSVNKHKNTG